MQSQRSTGLGVLNADPIAIPGFIACNDRKYQETVLKRSMEKQGSNNNNRNLTLRFTWIRAKLIWWDDAMVASQPES